MGGNALRSMWATVVLKYIGTALLAVLILPMVSGVGWAQAPLLAAVVTTLGYAFVDRGLLPLLGTEASVLVDFPLAVIGYWLAAHLLIGVPLGIGGALTSGGAFAVGDIIFHQYVLRKGVGVR